MENPLLRIKKIFVAILCLFIPFKETRVAIRKASSKGKLLKELEDMTKMNLKKWLFRLKRFCFDFKENRAFRHYVSIAAIVKDETLYIEEWLEFHRMLGVEMFYIYDNESSDGLEELLQPYIKEGIVDYKRFPGKRMQLVAYHDVIKRVKNETKWLALIDVDEFLVPVSAKTIPEFLKEFEDVPGVGVNWVSYGNGGQLKKAEGLVIERFKDHALPDCKFNHFFKTILNPRQVSHMPNPHYAWYYNGKGVDTHKEPLTGKSVQTPHAWDDKIRLNHYFTKSSEEYEIKRNRGRVHRGGIRNEKDFDERNRNEVKNDPIMDKYIPELKERLRNRK